MCQQREQTRVRELRSKQRNDLSERTRRLTVRTRLGSRPAIHRTSNRVAVRLHSTPLRSSGALHSATAPPRTAGCSRRGLLPFAVAPELGRSEDSLVSPCAGAVHARFRIAPAPARSTAVATMCFTVMSVLNLDVRSSCARCVVPLLARRVAKSALLRAEASAAVAIPAASRCVALLAARVLAVLPPSPRTAHQAAAEQRADRVERRAAAHHDRARQCSHTRLPRGIALTQD